MIYKKMHTDLVSKISSLSVLVNNDSSNIRDILIAVREMRSIVKHSYIIFQTVNEIHERTLSSLSNKIDDIKDEEDDYSIHRARFLHRKYEFDSDSVKPIDFIRLTKTLSMPKPAWITFNFPEEISFKIDKHIFRATLSEMRSLKFDYSPNIIKKRDKFKSHIGSIDTLETDLIRLRSHPKLLELENKKIKTYIVYYILLYLLLDAGKTDA